MFERDSKHFDGAKWQGQSNAAIGDKSWPHLMPFPSHNCDAACDPMLLFMQP